MQIVPFGPEVIVNHVEDHGDAARVSGIDEGDEVLGTTVAMRRCEGKHAVVPPVERTGRLGDRHQFDCRNAEIRKMIETLGGRAVGAPRRKRANVQFVEDVFVASRGLPCGSRDRSHVDNLALAVYAVGLKARRGIG